MDRCEKHQTYYYASGKCLGCEGEEAAADRKTYKEEQTQNKVDGNETINKEIPIVQVQGQ
jgi:hypothetical protein